MKNNSDNAPIPKSCLASVSGSVTEKDLMIGNLVFLPSGIVYIVDIVYKNYAMLKYWRAIPITEKWLKFLGFEKTNESKDVEWYSLNRVNISTEEIENITYIVHESTVFRHIKYVHQLQNIYYSLTGLDLQLVDLTDR